MVQQRIQQDIDAGKKSNILNDLWDKRHNERVSVVCVVPRYYYLIKLKEQFPLNNFSQLRLTWLDKIYNSDHTWWLVYIKDDGDAILYRMYSSFHIKNIEQKRSCFHPNSKLMYLGLDGYYYMSIED